jgi:hypothetical protein
MNRSWQTPDPGSSGAGADRHTLWIQPLQEQEPPPGCMITPRGMQVGVCAEKACLIMTQFMPPRRERYTSLPTCLPAYLLPTSYLLTYLPEFTTPQARGVLVSRAHQSRHRAHSEATTAVVVRRRVRHCAPAHRRTKHTICWMRSKTSHAAVGLR